MTAAVMTHGAMGLMGMRGCTHVPLLPYLSIPYLACGADGHAGLHTWRGPSVVGLMSRGLPM